MKKCASWLGVMVVLFFVVCVTGLLPDMQSFSHTMMTGQVLQRDSKTITLSLGELVLPQTAESAESTSLLRSSIAQPVRLLSNVTPNGQALKNETKVFVSWQQDTVLDLSNAACFTVGDNGAMQATTPENISPQDILNVTMGADNTPIAVFVLTDISQSEKNTESLQGTAAHLIMENTSLNGEEYESRNADENALRVLSAKADLRNVQVNKSEGAGSDRELEDRYGMNAALLAAGGANLIFDRSAVDSAVEGSSGIFAYGNGTSLQLNNGTVTTTGDHSEGLQASGAASIQARDMTVTTSGDCSAVLCAEKGNLKVVGGTYTSGGYRSPVIFASGKISANGAELTANNAAVAVLQGPGTVLLENCNLRSSATGDGSATQAAEIPAVLIQGGSVPAWYAVSFAMKAGSISCQNSTVFFVEDTDCDITLENINVMAADNAAFLRVTGTADTGSDVTLNVSRQTIKGNIVVDSNSTLQLDLQDASLLCGAILPSNDGVPAGDTSVHIEPGCTWSLTGDSEIDTLENEGTIEFNGYTITLGDGTVLTS